jgi:hypothetical protein
MSRGIGFLNLLCTGFNKPLSQLMAWNIVARCREVGAIGKPSPHELLKTAITQAINTVINYRWVQMMDTHKDPKTVMKYDPRKENLNLNAVNFLL